MGKSKAPKVKTSPLEQASADIAKRQDVRAQKMEQQWIDPIRGVVTPQILQALGTNPFQTTLNAADRHTLEAQYGQAKNQLMNTAAPGGQLRSQMAGLERDRAQAIGNAANQARQLGLGRALQFAGGALPTNASLSAQEQGAMSGLTAANQTASQRALANAQAQSQEAQGKGKGLGGLLGQAFLGGTKPWIFG